MDDQTLNRLFDIYIVKRSILTFPKEESFLEQEKFIFVEGGTREVTERGAKYIEGLDKWTKIKLTYNSWPFKTFLSPPREIWLRKVVESFTLEELPELLIDPRPETRKIAIETYKKLKEVGR